MSKQVILDPEKLEQFARQLDTINKELGETLRRLSSLSKGLGETWRDTEYEKFIDEFERTMNSLRVFNRSTEDTIIKLKRTATKGHDVYNR